jgi:branched-chain amino acid transport system ATP-binding protein
MMLEVQQVCVDFDAFRAVNDVSLTISSGELLGIAGTNGAGKSTLFAAIAGQQATSTGRIMFQGQDVTSQPVYARARLGLARTFQTPREFARLTVLENLLAAAPNKRYESIFSCWFARNASKRHEQELIQHADEILEFVRLSVVRNQHAGGLSGGQKKLLELARVLMLKPSLIMLDEPFAGVNPVLIGAIVAVLEKLNKQGIALVIVEHHLQALKSFVQRLVVMDQGQILADGDPHLVLEDSRVQAAYMGGVV